MFSFKDFLNQSKCINHGGLTKMLIPQQPTGVHRGELSAKMKMKIQHETFYRKLQRSFSCLAATVIFEIHKIFISFFFCVEEHENSEQMKKNILYRFWDLCILCLKSWFCACMKNCWAFGSIDFECVSRQHLCISLYIILILFLISIFFVIFIKKNKFI